ncbi:beta-ketoacyl synthase N-terminal-like domain-containing protein, partial [Neisseria sp. P0021.S004]
LLSALKQGGSNDYQGWKIRFSECAASQKCGFFCLANQFGFGGSNTSLVWQWQP